MTCLPPATAVAAPTSIFVDNIFCKAITMTCRYISICRTAGTAASCTSHGFVTRQNGTHHQRCTDLVNANVALLQDNLNNHRALRSARTNQQTHLDASSVSGRRYSWSPPLTHLTAPCCTAQPGCCSHINSHIQVRGHRTGSSCSGVGEYPRKTTQTKSGTRIYHS